MARPERPDDYARRSIDKRLGLLDEAAASVRLDGCCDLLAPEGGWPAWAERARVLLRRRGETG